MTERDAPASTADDGYERYYTEKLWGWIPEEYRRLDAEENAGDALRALIEAVGAEAAALRRDMDRLWDDQSIELADPWAIRYLGDLVGAPSLRAATPRAARLAAANAVAYQRRNGTPGLLRDMILDLTGMEGKVVEAFRRLVRFPHRLDVAALEREPVTATPTGGLVDLRNPRVASLGDGPFDEAAHFPDIRRSRGPLGRYGLAKVNLHLAPFLADAIARPTPAPIGEGRATLDPSGRDVPLFQRGGARADRQASRVLETDLPIPIACRRFNASEHALTESAFGAIGDPAIETALRPLLGATFRSAADFRRRLAARLTPAQFSSALAAILDATLLEDAPKAALWGSSLAFSLDGAPLPPSAVIAADLSQWQAPPPLPAHVAIAFDPATGRTLDGPARGEGAFRADILHAGVFSSIGAGGLGRGEADMADAAPVDPGGDFLLPSEGSHLFARSATHRLTPSDEEIGEVRLIAQTGARPYVRLGSGARDFTIRAPSADRAGRLEIDGLWLASAFATAFAPPPAGEAAPRPIQTRLVLEGHFDRVVLRRVTLDPGGERARPAPDLAAAIPHVTLTIRGRVDALEIDRCVTGPIEEDVLEPDFCNAGRIELRDSVVSSVDPIEPAIATRASELSLTRCTVLGDVDVARLFASDSIVDGRVRVADNQAGCFRYSATGDHGGAARLPRRFEAHVVDGAMPRHWLASRRFGDPSFATLAETAPDALRRGADKGGEMGAHGARALTLRLEDLADLVARHLPIGLTPQFILERDGWTSP